MSLEASRNYAQELVSGNFYTNRHAFIFESQVGRKAKARQELLGILKDEGRCVFPLYGNCFGIFELSEEGKVVLLDVCVRPVG